MELRFLYSKEKKKKNLLHIFDEYQWFIDNNFHIVVPKFYAKVYGQNKHNRKAFASKMSKELNITYNKNNYQMNLQKIKTNWQKIEPKFFNIFKSFNFNLRDKYICYTLLYGPNGQFEYPNIINLRAQNRKDIAQANIIIAHEIIHLSIYNKAKKMELNYKQTEGVVDLFFTETELSKIFPQYGLQSV
ncbi:MAG: hypothetical protein NT094_05350, partial [Candidatus Staskawiczbacteria bacterium]|nr:hypothetical protein [Candidatus Staskawiczbacteria bacterium]